MPSCAHYAYTHYIILGLQISVIVSSIPTAGILLLFHLPVRRSTVNLLHGRMIVRPQIRHISGHGFPLWEFMTCACWTELSFPICKSKRLQIIISIQTFLYRFDPTVSVSGLHNSHRGNCEVRFIFKFSYFTFYYHYLLCFKCLVLDQIKITLSSTNMVTDRIPTVGILSVVGEPTYTTIITWNSKSNTLVTINHDFNLQPIKNPTVGIFMDHSGLSTFNC